MDGLVLPNTRDFFEKGVTLKSISSVIEFEVPNGGATVYDIKLSSLNVKFMEVVCSSVGNSVTGTIRGAPSALPREQFLKDRTLRCMIKNFQTTDGLPPAEVTLCVLVCDDQCEVEPHGGHGDQSGEVVKGRHGKHDHPSSTSSTTVEVPPGNEEGLIKPPPCVSIDFINALIVRKGIHIDGALPANIGDFLKNGVTFTETNSTIELEIPNGGATVYDIKLSSSNVVEIEVVCSSVTNFVTAPIRGSPLSLPSEQFLKERTARCTIKNFKTTDGLPPADVTLSVLVCDDQCEDEPHSGHADHPSKDEKKSHGHDGDDKKFPHESRHGKKKQQAKEDDDEPCDESEQKQALMEKDDDPIKSHGGAKHRGTDELGVDGMRNMGITPERTSVDEEPGKPGRRIKSRGKEKRSLLEGKAMKSNGNNMKLNGEEVHLNEKNMIGIEKFHHVDDSGSLSCPCHQIPAWNIFSRHHIIGLENLRTILSVDQYAKIQSETVQLSSFLSKQIITEGNTVEHHVDDDDQPTPLIIHVDQTNCHGVAILKFDANELFNASSILSIELQTTLIVQINLIVINVLGRNPILPANIKFNNNPWMNDSANARTIWNFYQAETLELRNVFMGAILAPLAAVQTNATIIGSIAAQSLMTTSDIQHSTVVMPTCI